MAKRVSYAMAWQIGDEPRLVGRIEVDAEVVTLTATVPRAAARRIALLEVVSVTLSKGVLQLTQRTGPSVAIVSLDRPGALRELGDRIYVAASSRERREP